MSAAGRDEGLPELVQIRARSQVVGAGFSVVLCIAVVVIGVVASEVWAAIGGTIGIALSVLISWMPCVVFGPEEMVVTNVFRSRIIRYDDVERITFNGRTWVHDRSLVLVSRTDGWVSVDAIRRRLLLALCGLDDQSRRMRAEVERRVQLARTRP